MRSKNRSKRIRKCICCLMIAFTVFMVVGRTISGVHWLTDIMGGALLSAGLVMLYGSVIKWLSPGEDEKNELQLSKSNR